MKQIEEMAKVIKSSLDGLGYGNFNFTGEEISTMFAKALYNAGYRKQSEIARELFEEIEKILVRSEAPTALFYHCSKHNYAELKKKYTEAEK